MAQACGGTYRGKEKDTNREVAGVVLDSRLLEKDFCFVATKGERVDGHSFIAQVLEAGALCVVCQHIPQGMEDQGNFIVVRDPFLALRDIAEYYRSTLSLPVIGVTGSVGKTSTKEFIASVLGQKYNVLKTEGNFNNEVGVPLTLLRIRPEHEIAVVEMGINHFGEMRRLSRMVRPDTCVMTNIGECHLEYLGSREGVLRAKSEIFDYVGENGTVFVNGDDDMLQSIQQVKHKRPVTFGLEANNDYYADNILGRGLAGCSALIHTPSGSFEADIPLPGGHMIRNALAATAIGELYGLTNAEIAAGIAAVSPVEGRSNLFQNGNMTVIDDCYNANPVSMRAALDLLAQAGGRTVAILGDMGELGLDEVRFHTEIGAYAVERGVRELICVGRLARHMYRGGCYAKEKKPHSTFVRYFETPEALLEELGKITIPGEKLTVLVKASHSMGFSRIVERLRNWNGR